MSQRTNEVGKHASGYGIRTEAVKDSKLVANYIDGGDDGNLNIYAQGSMVYGIRTLARNSNSLDYAAQTNIKNIDNLTMNVYGHFAKGINSASKGKTEIEAKGTITINVGQELVDPEIESKDPRIAEKATGIEIGFNSVALISADEVKLNVEGKESAYGMRMVSSGKNKAFITASNVEMNVKSGGEAYGMHDGQSSQGEFGNLIRAGDHYNLTLKINAEGAEKSYAMYATSDGNNTIEGGIGGDKIELHGDVYAARAGQNRIETGEGDDHIIIKGNLYADKFGENIIDTGDGNDTVKVVGQMYSHASSGKNLIDTGEGHDHIILDGSVGSDALTIKAGDGVDMLSLKAEDLATLDSNYKEFIQGMLKSEGHDIEVIHISGVDNIPTWLEDAKNDHNDDSTRQEVRIITDAKLGEILGVDPGDDGNYNFDGITNIMDEVSKWYENYQDNGADLTGIEHLSAMTAQDTMDIEALLSTESEIDFDYSDGALTALSSEIVPEAGELMAAYDGDFEGFDLISIDETITLDTILPAEEVEKTKSDLNLEGEIETTDTDHIDDSQTVIFADNLDSEDTFSLDEMNLLIDSGTF